MAKVIYDVFSLFSCVIDVSTYWRRSGAQEMFKGNSADLTSGVRLTQIIPFQKRNLPMNITHRFAMT